MHTGRCNANVFFSNVNWGAGLSHMHNSKNGSLYCKCLFFQWKLGDGPPPHGQLREHGNSQSSRAMQLRSVEVRPHRKLGKGPTRYCPSQISKLDSNKNWGAGISHTGRCIENVFFFQWKLGGGPLPRAQLQEHGNSWASRATQLRSVKVRPRSRRDFQARV